jgi:hypothetical protein
VNKLSQELEEMDVSGARKREKEREVLGRGLG